MTNLLFSPCRPQILLVKPRYKQLSCFHSFPKAGNDQLWWLHGRKVHGGLLFFFFFFFPWISSSEQKESLLKSLASFLPRAAQTRCVKWELPGCDFSRKHPLAIVCLVNFCRPQRPDFHTWEIKGYQGAFEKEGLNVRRDKPVHKILISFAC